MMEYTKKNRRCIRAVEQRGLAIATEAAHYRGGTKRITRYVLLWTGAEWQKATIPQYDFKKGKQGGGRNHVEFKPLDPTEALGWALSIPTAEAGYGDIVSRVEMTIENIGAVLVKYDQRVQEILDVLLREKAQQESFWYCYFFGGKRRKLQRASPRAGQKDLENFHRRHLAGDEIGELCQFTGAEYAGTVATSVKDWQSE